MKVRKFALEMDYYREVCNEIKKHAIYNIEKKGSFNIVLSGGNSPKKIFDILSENVYSVINWERVVFFWVDERLVPPESQENNYYLAQQFLFSKRGISKNIFPINVNLSPEDAAADYQKLIFSQITEFRNDIPVFDFILLGMGPDGHIASIFPNTPEQLYKKYVFALEEITSGFVRISMGIPLINNASVILLLVNSRSKREVFEQYGLDLPVHKLNFSKTIILTYEGGD